MIPVACDREVHLDSGVGVTKSRIVYYTRVLWQHRAPAFDVKTGKGHRFPLWRTTKGCRQQPEKKNTHRRK